MTLLTATNTFIIIMADLEKIINKIRLKKQQPNQPGLVADGTSRSVDL